MRDASEIAGVIALWVLGMTAAVPASWPVWLVVLAAVVSAGAVIFYASRAIAERRSGNSHYFTMALLGVTLTVISLSATALQLQGGGRFLLSLAIGLGLVFLSVVYFKNRRRPPSSAA